MINQNVKQAVEFSETLILMKYPLWIFSQVMDGFVEVVAPERSPRFMRSTYKELGRRQTQRYWNGMKNALNERATS